MQNLITGGQFGPRSAFTPSRRTSRLQGVLIEESGFEPATARTPAGAICARSARFSAVNAGRPSGCCCPDLALISTPADRNAGRARPALAHDCPAAWWLSRKVHRLPICRPSSAMRRPVRTRACPYRGGSRSSSSGGGPPSLGCAGRFSRTQSRRARRTRRRARSGTGCTARRARELRGRRRTRGGVERE